MGMSEIILNAILEVLGNPISNNEFYNLIKNLNYCNDSDKITTVINETKKFLKYFGRYLKISEFRKRVFNIIKISYEICDNIENLERLDGKMKQYEIAEIFDASSMTISNINLGKSWRHVI